MFLDDDAFKNVNKEYAANLNDLIIQNEKVSILVGKRTTAPQGAFGCSWRSHTKK